MPGTICGQDCDDLFKMATPKYVYIRDARLGLLKYFFMLLIFVYVVIYDIMYACDHLTPTEAHGYGTITMQHPIATTTCTDVRQACTNMYRNIADLKYCSQAMTTKTERLLSKAKVDKGDSSGKAKDNSSKMMRDFLNGQVTDDDSSSKTKSTGSNAAATDTTKKDDTSTGVAKANNQKGDTDTKGKSTKDSSAAKGQNTKGSTGVKGKSSNSESGTNQGGKNGNNGSPKPDANGKSNANNKSGANGNNVANGKSSASASSGANGKSGASGKSSTSGKSGASGKTRASSKSAGSGKSGVNRKSAASGNSGASGAKTQRDANSQTVVRGQGDKAGTATKKSAKGQGQEAKAKSTAKNVPGQGDAKQKSAPVQAQSGKGSSQDTIKISSADNTPKQSGDAEEDGKLTMVKQSGDTTGASRPSGAAGPPPQVGDFITKPGTCRYLDQDRLTLQHAPNEIFVPMRYASYEQEMSGDCYDPQIQNRKGSRARSHSDKYYDCKESWVTSSLQDFYVADIGQFKLRLQHSFMAPSIGMSGVSTDYKGFFAACPVNKPKDVNTDCQRMQVPNTTGEVAPEDLIGLVDPKKFGVESLRGTRDGLDEITFADLLKLTPVAQKYIWNDDIPDRKLPPGFGHPDTSIRESGGMLMLSVNYDNTGYGRPGFPGLDMFWALLGAIKPVTYNYRPYFVPTIENKKVEVMMSSDNSKKRIVNIWYGVTVKMSFEGKLVAFSFSKLLTSFTTGLILLSSATTIVTYLALYICQYKKKYQLQMYQYTEDMTDYSQLKSTATPSDVDYATGQVILDARRANRSLAPEEVTEILTDYEIRLNRLDGHDPELAFTTNEQMRGTEPVAPLHVANLNFRRLFFNRFKTGAGARTITPRSQQIY